MHVSNCSVSLDGRNFQAGFALRPWKVLVRRIDTGEDGEGELRLANGIW